MTNPDHGHITIVADRTGSMQAIRTDAEGAVNQFIDDQKTTPGAATLLLIDFDSTQPHRVVHDGDIRGFEGRYQLAPRGMTPLYDAIGHAITLTGQRLAAIAEHDRPGHVFVVIATDGAENASREYTREQVTALIKEHEEKYSWEFVFLATGPDAWAAASSFAGTGMMGNVVNTYASGQSYAAAAAHVSSNVSERRVGGQSAGWAADVDDEGNVAPRS